MKTLGELSREAAAAQRDVERLAQELAAAKRKAWITQLAMFDAMGEENRNGE